MLRELSRWIDAVQERVGRFTSFVRWPWCLSSSSTWCSATRSIARLGLHAGAGVAPVRGELSLAAGYTMLYDEHVRVDIAVFAVEPPQARLGQFHLRLPVLLSVGFPGDLHGDAVHQNSFMVNEGSPDAGRCARAVGAEVRHPSSARAARSAGGCRRRSRTSTSPWGGKSPRSA